MSTDEVHKYSSPATCPGCDGSGCYEGDADDVYD